jgi:hypothetical protein
VFDSCRRSSWVQGVVTCVHLPRASQCVMGDAQATAPCQRRNKQPLSATHLSTMQPRAFARLKLPFVAHGCNSARHYAVAAQRKKHGRKRLSEEELAEEEDRAKCMLHSRVTADATYG